MWYILRRDLGNRYSSFNNVLPNNSFLFPRLLSVAVIHDEFILRDEVIQ